MFLSHGLIGMFRILADKNRLLHWSFVVFVGIWSFAGFLLSGLFTVKNRLLCWSFAFLGYLIFCWFL
jgi:hypothetical protein